MAGQDPLAAIGGIPASAGPTPSDPLAAIGGVPATSASSAASTPQLSIKDQILQAERTPVVPEPPATPPQNHKEEVVKSIAGDTGLGIYRSSLNTVRKVESLLQSPSEAYDAAKQELKEHLADAYGPEPQDLNPAHHTISATPIFPEAEVVNAARAMIAAPEDIAETATSVAQKSTARVNPFRATSKIEPAVEANVSKAGLPAGTPEVTPEAAKVANTQAVKDAQAATQANVDQTIQNITQQHSATHGLPTPKAGTATRDLLQNNGNALINSGKADYQILDKYTDGEFTNVQKELKNAQVERTMNAGKTGFDADTLDANVLRAQLKLDQLFDDAVKNGMDKTVADTARTKFAAGNATLDVAHDLRMANKVAGTAGERATNLNQLENRWQARYDEGRLQQAFGSDAAAQDAINQIHSARVTADQFASMPPTEAHALRDLISKNTTTGTFGTSTNWIEVRNDFSKLGDRAARFSDVPEVENFINRQATLQRLRKWGTGTAAAGIGIGAAEAAREAIMK